MAPRSPFRLMRSAALGRYGHTMRVPARDVLPAAVLFATAQYEVWLGPLFDGLPGPRLANAVLALVFVPLLWRRSRPVLSFGVVLVAAWCMQRSTMRRGWSRQTREWRRCGSRC